MDRDAIDENVKTLTYGVARFQRLMNEVFEYNFPEESFSYFGPVPLDGDPFIEDDGGTDYFVAMERLSEVNPNPSIQEVGDTSAVSFLHTIGGALRRLFRCLISAVRAAAA
ncbi:MAG: hypothetical protein WBD40_09170 [Tepidisphaeraceae bacterium]